MVLQVELSYRLLGAVLHTAAEMSWRPQLPIYWLQMPLKKAPSLILGAFQRLSTPRPITPHKSCHQLDALSAYV